MTTEQSSIIIESFVDPDKLASDLSVNMNDLDGHIRRYGSLLAFYAAQSARARHQYDNVKNRCAALESLLEHQIRESFTGEKVTEAMIASALKRNPKWSAIQAKIADARLQHELAENAYQAFRAQKDMLVQISMDRRTERQGEIRVKGVEADRSNMMKAIAANRQ